MNSKKKLVEEVSLLSARISDMDDTLWELMTSINELATSIDTLVDEIQGLQAKVKE
jgi:prefoldin subunit 5